MEGKYLPIRPKFDGSLLSQTTGVVFRPDGTQLRLTDAVTGAPLLRREEETTARRLAEENAAAEARARRRAEKNAAAEAIARREAEEKVRALEEELARLRRPTQS